LLVILPALNEAGSVAGVVHQVRHSLPAADVLLIDDGSSDDTASLAADAGATVVSLPYNMGVGTALRTGFKYAARNGYDVVVQTDADGQHLPDEIPKLLEALDSGADLAIGTRFANGDGHYAVDLSRGLAMRLLLLLVRALTGRRLTDTTSGFRAFSRPLVHEFASTYPREFLSDTVEALVIASYRGFAIAEVPVRMRHRSTGAPSHRSVRLLYHYLRVIVVLGLSASMRGRRVARGIGSA